jgi:hypothetical protein
MNRPSARFLALGALLAACGSDAVCVALPCPFSQAVTITITSASANVPLPAGVFVTFTYNGKTTATGFCTAGSPTTCEVPGPGGTYQLAIGAPGFQTTSRTANVNAPAAEKCGCSVAQTQHFDIALVPAS